MTGTEALQSVQFVTVRGKRFALLDASDWEAFVEWVETLEDSQAARQALEELRKTGGNREQAGWLKWDDVQGEIK